MIEFDEETVVRHPFAGWVPDRAGNPSNRPQFGSDMAIERALYADADSGEPPDGLHSAVEVRANLYLPPGLRPIRMMSGRPAGNAGGSSAPGKSGGLPG